MGLCLIRLAMCAEKEPRGVCFGAFCVGSSAVGIVAGLLGVVPLTGGPAVAGDRLRGVGTGAGACLWRCRSAAVAACLGAGRGGPVAGSAAVWARGLRSWGPG